MVCDIRSTGVTSPYPHGIIGSVSGSCVKRLPSVLVDRKRLHAPTQQVEDAIVGSELLDMGTAALVVDAGAQREDGR